MATTYKEDVVQWAREQAEFIRLGHFDKLDLEHIAEEIDDVGKSEYRELSNRMALLISHLLKWKFQPVRRCTSWQKTIKEQRKGIERRLTRTPSLKTDFYDLEWFADAWSDGFMMATNETGIDDMPNSPIWALDDIICSDFWPD